MNILLLRFSPAALLLALASAGCSKAYWTDRGRDGLDVLTVAGEWISAGAMVQVGPVALGVNQVAKYHGESGGQGLIGGQFTDYRVFEQDCIVHVHSFRDFWDDTRRKESAVAGVFPLPYLWAYTPEKNSFWQAPGGFPEAGDWHRWLPRYTTIEVTAGFLGGLRLGVNPGEFVDFLTGWFGLDLYGDDVAEREIQKEPEKKPPDGEKPRGSQGAAEPPGREKG